MTCCRQDSLIYKHLLAGCRELAAAAAALGTVCTRSRRGDLLRGSLLQAGAVGLLGCALHHLWWRAGWDRMACLPRPRPAHPATPAGLRRKLRCSWTDFTPKQASKQASQRSLPASAPAGGVCPGQGGPVRLPGHRVDRHQRAPAGAQCLAAALIACGWVAPVWHAPPLPGTAFQSMSPPASASPSWLALLPSWDEDAVQSSSAGQPPRTDSQAADRSRSHQVTGRVE